MKFHDWTGNSWVVLFLHLFNVSKPYGMLPASMSGDPVAQ